MNNKNTMSQDEIENNPFNVLARLDRRIAELDQQFVQRVEAEAVADSEGTAKGQELDDKLNKIRHRRWPEIYRADGSKVEKPNLGGSFEI